MTSERLSRRALALGAVVLTSATLIALAAMASSAPTRSSGFRQPKKIESECSHESSSQLANPDVPIADRTFVILENERLLGVVLRV
jgi:hypothetical protein